MDVIARGAGTVADPARDGDTLGALGAIPLVLAAREDTILAHLAVGWLATAVGSVALVTLQERVAVVARRTLTVIAAGQILAKGVETAHRLGRGGQAALVDVPAQAGRLALESPLAHALALGAELA